MKKILIMLAVLFFTASAASALTVTVKFDNPDANLDALAADIKNELENGELKKFDNMPKLAKGFANSNTYASGAGTMRGYQGYDIFGISIGTMLSVQAPSSDPSFYKDLQDDLDNGDVYAGMGANLLAGQIGLNLSFLVDDLYLAFRFGKFNSTLGGETDDFKVGLDSGLFGILLNYQLIGQKSILGRSMLWRGISVESGFIYSKNKTSFYKEMGNIEANGGSLNATVDQSINFIIDNKSYIIPVELYTSVRLLYILNLGVGAGFDFVAGGETTLKMESDGNINIAEAAYQDRKGTIDIDSKTKADADKFRGKVMANVGVSLGPVFVDMPVTIYMDNGYSVGLSAGLVW